MSSAKGNCRSKIFNFSWDLQSQIEVEKKAHAKFLGDNKEYYGIFEKGLLRTYILEITSWIFMVLARVSLECFLLLLLSLFAVFVFLDLSIPLSLFFLFFATLKC